MGVQKCSCSPDRYQYVDDCYGNIRRGPKRGLVCGGCYRRKHQYRYIIHYDRYGSATPRHGCWPSVGLVVPVSVRGHLHVGNHYLYFYRNLRTHDRSVSGYIHSADPDGHHGQPGVGADGSELSEIVACPRIPGVFDRGVCGYLLCIGPEYCHFHRHKRCHLDLHKKPDSKTKATASRKYDPLKPTVSPREWAQTAAVGIALRNAGFGLQFGAAGDDFDSAVPDELGAGASVVTPAAAPIVPEVAVQSGTGAEPVATPVPEKEQEVVELTDEQRFEQACAIISPIKKHGGRTLGDVLTMEPSAINWLANKFKGDETIKAAAQFICSYALEQATA